MRRPQLMDLGRVRTAQAGQRMSSGPQAYFPLLVNLASREPAYSTGGTLRSSWSPAVATLTQCAKSSNKGSLGMREAIIHSLLRSKRFEPNVLSPGCPLYTGKHTPPSPN